MSLRPPATTTAAMLPEIERDTLGTVIAVTGKTCRVQLAGGDVLSGIDASGVAVGQTLRLRYAGGTYTVQGGAGGGSSGGGGAFAGGSGGITGAPSPHDLLGVHHNLPTLAANLFLAAPVSASGLPAFRAIVPADLPGQFAGFANPSAQIGLTAINGSATTAMRSDAAPAINAAIAPTWSGLHTFNAGATIAAGQYLNFGADVALTRFGANVLTTGADDSVRSPNFVSGIAGWTIDGTGDAEFNNIVVRGELRAFVFKINELAATAGTFGVFYSAATTYADFTTPATTGSSFTFQAKNTDAGAMLLGVNDVCRTKAWNGAGIVDAWFTVTARTNNTTYTTYTATMNGGSTSATIREGTAIVDYGPNSGTSGFITLSADGTVGSSPNITLATHAGAPWTTITPQMRIGNLNGYGSYATNVYGIAIGNPTGAWMTAEGGVVKMRQGANDVIVLDGGANSSYFAGVVTIGTSGEIRQGTGTLGSNYTGLRIWNSSGIGLIAGYNSNTIQWQAGTDGKLYAGGGNVMLDVNGISVAAQWSGYTSDRAYKFTSPNNSSAGVYAFYSAYSSSISLRNYTVSGVSNYVAVESNAVGTADAQSTVGAYNSVGSSYVNVTSLSGIAIYTTSGNISYYPAAGRNYFHDSELSTGNGLRVGAAWSMYGIYAESGYCVVGGASGVNVQNGVVQVTSGVGILRSPVNNTTQALAISGGMSVEGANGGYKIFARDDADEWTIYATGDNLRFYYGGGDMMRVDVLGRAWQGNNSSSWSTTSDVRIKDVRGNYRGGLAEILRIRPVEYEFNGRGGFKADGKRHVGVIAQEIAAVLPDTVYSIGRVDDIEKMLAVDPSEIVWALVNAVKEMEQKIAMLEASNGTRH